MTKKIMVLTLLFAPMAFADVNCPKAKVENLQPQTSFILVRQVGQGWHRLGNTADPGVQAMYSALLAAQMAGKPVVIRYPAGFDCNAYEIDTPAKMVRTYNE